MKKEKTTYVCCEYGELSDDGKSLICRREGNDGAKCHLWRKGAMSKKLCQFEINSNRYNVMVEKDMKTSEIVSVKSKSFAIRKDGVKLFYNDPRLLEKQRDADIHITWDKTNSFSLEGFLGASSKHHERSLDSVSRACDWFFHCLEELELDFQQKLKAISELKERMAKGILENHVQMTEEEKGNMLREIDIILSVDKPLKINYDSDDK